MLTETTGQSTPADGGTLSYDQAVSQLAELEERGAPPESDAAETGDADPEQDTADDDAELSPDDVEGEGEDDAPAEEEGYAPAHLKVTLQDGSTVTVGELAKGHLRQADYTRKTQELAEIRKSAEMTAQQAQAVEQHFRARLDIIARQLQAEAPPEPDYRLAETDPFEYQRQFARHQSWSRQQQALVSEYQQAEQIRQQREAQSYNAWLAEQAKALPEIMPEWRDPAKLTAAKQVVREYARSAGYTDEQLASVSAIDMVTLWKAARYNAILATKSQVKAKAAPQRGVIQPTARRDGSAVRQTIPAELRAKLSPTGAGLSTDEAVRLLTGL